MFDGDTTYDEVSHTTFKLLLQKYEIQEVNTVSHNSQACTGWGQRSA